MFNGKIHYKWSFSIAVLNYQRVYYIQIWIRQTILMVVDGSNPLSSHFPKRYCGWPGNSPWPRKALEREDHNLLEWTGDPSGWGGCERCRWYIGTSHGHSNGNLMNHDFLVVASDCLPALECFAKALPSGVWHVLCWFFVCLHINCMHAHVNTYADMK